MPFPVSAVLLVALLSAVAYLLAQVAGHAGIPAPVAVTLVCIATGGMFSAAPDPVTRDERRSTSAQPAQ